MLAAISSQSPHRSAAISGTHYPGWQGSAGDGCGDTSSSTSSSPTISTLTRLKPSILKTRSIIKDLINADHMDEIFIIDNATAVVVLQCPSPGPSLSLKSTRATQPSCSITATPSSCSTTTIAPSTNPSKLTSSALTVSCERGQAYVYDTGDSAGRSLAGNDPNKRIRNQELQFMNKVSHALAHPALVQNGAVFVFANRPKAPPTNRIFNNDQRNISSAAYGPTWRPLRRNLTSEILHHSRVKSYFGDRRWALHVLVHRLLLHSDEPVRVMDHFQYAVFCLLVFMCFGDKLDDKQIQQIESVQRWKELLRLRRDQEDVLIPLVKARISLKAKRQQGAKTEDFVVAYVDTLVDLELPEQGFKRKLTEGEMVSLCSEFLNAGTETAAAALEWIMADLVKYPEIQGRLYEEIVGVKGPPPTAVSFGQEMTAVVEEEDVHRMRYLKAVVLESLRHHPPGHFVLPHSVTEEVELEGHVVPQNATVNFMVAEMGWDPKCGSNPWRLSRKGS
ncbi:hypothetical protein RJ639_014088 [Escallonia herrerae]|uniref:Cytochrome P450 n=1 Tax=Escallonia herrerae TaxID=1293975 RepID=A0AA88VGR4_9ASTE|nr:hypothetical protein RJ639_014088 [Escallonia herrerae]